MSRRGVTRTFRTPPAQTLERLEELVAHRRVVHAAAVRRLAEAKAGTDADELKKAKRWLRVRTLKLRQAERGLRDVRGWCREITRQGAEVAAWREAVGR